LFLKIAHVERIFDGELEKHLPWSAEADWRKSGEKTTVAGKLQLYEALFVSVFTYGAECWTLKEKMNKEY